MIELKIHFKSLTNLAQIEAFPAIPPPPFTFLVLAGIFQNRQAKKTGSVEGKLELEPLDTNFETGNIKESLIEISINIFVYCAWRACKII